MIKRVLALVLAFAMSATAAAPTMFSVDGSTNWERGRLTRLEQSLNFTKEPMPDTWNIHIIPEVEFQQTVQRLKMNTISAYTYLPLDQTYINEGYLLYADDRAVRHTLAHEAGHMICSCTSESKANDIAFQLEY